MDSSFLNRPTASRVCGRCHTFGAAVALLAAGMAYPACAQPRPAAEQRVQKANDADPQGKAAGSQDTQRVTVTGSRLATDGETASPVTVLTAEDIRRSGATTAAELLRALPIAGEGSLNDTAAEDDFAAGANSISLRGLGSDVTLILLNGRRIATHGFARVGNGTQFVNLDTLPVGMIDRIEVLKDGASALYGSEAVAGVINVILRSDFTGLELGALASQNAAGAYRQRRASLTWGFGDVQRDGYNVVINAERFERDAVPFRKIEQFLAKGRYRDEFGVGVGQSSFSSPGTIRYGTAIGTRSIAQPGCVSVRQVLPDVPDDGRPPKPGEGVGDPPQGDEPPPPPEVVNTECVYDIWGKRQLAPRVQRNSVFLRGTATLSPQAELFAEFSATRNSVLYRQAPIGTNALTFYSGSNYSPIVTPLLEPADYPPDPDRISPARLEYRFEILGDATREVVTTGLRALAGMRGQSRDWDWETAVLLASSDTKETFGGYIRGSAFRAAREDGSFAFATAPSTDPAVLAAISPKVVNRGKSSLAQLDAKASSQFGRLPGGPVALALGAEVRHERLDSAPDELIRSGDMSYLLATSAAGSRLISSGYVEGALPILPQFDAHLAARLDSYSDVGSAVSPKIGLKWKVHPQIALRSTFSRGFRAPALTETQSGRSAFFTTVVDNAYCRRLFDDGERETYNCLPSTAQVTSDGNPDLKPERSASYTAGIVIAVAKEAKVTVDYFDVRRLNQVRQLSPEYLLANESNFPDRVVRNEDGRLVRLISGFANIGQTQVQGIDFEAMGRVGLGTLGALSGNVSLTRLLSSRESGTAVSRLELLGYYDRPRTRSYTSVSWEYRSFVTTLNYRYTSGFDYRLSAIDGCPYELAVGDRSPNCRIDAHHSVGLVLGWQPMRGVRLSLAVNNLTNRQPSFDARRSSIMFNPTYSDPRDRSYSLNATYTFQ